MRKTKNTLGFTMAEMLIVVAIIIVLSGVAFIAVQNHQRSMAQLERNAIAKEIFIAAQNHLTMAESEGYPVSNPGDSYFGTTAQNSSSPSVETNESSEGTTTTGEEEGTTTDTDKKPTNVYYVIGPASGNILDLMLPFGSIDETVRAGGSYLIRYQTNPALVLDVFYVTTSGNPTRFNKEGGIKSDDYSDLMGTKDNLPSSGYVLGYYGGEEALQSGEIILAPTVEVHNGERLTVTVTDLNNNNVDPNKRNANAALKLIISGETSGAKMAIALDSNSTTSTNGRFSFSNQDMNYTVILDDITTSFDNDSGDGLHFADLNAYATSSDTDKVIEFWKNGNTTPTFLPGENITVQAVSYSNTALTNIAYSSARTTNSLFADPGATGTTAMIGNFRHLENLDASISKLDNSLGYTAAEQIADLTWINVNDEEAGFVAAIGELKNTVKVYKLNDSTGGTENCYLPVTPSVFVKGSGTTEDSTVPFALSYKGNSHSITGVEINVTGDAGLFGSMTTGSAVANLELVDFMVNGNDKSEENTDSDGNTITTVTSSNVGALAGTLTSCTVTNVVAYNTPRYETKLASDKTTIISATGSAGGLIGNMDGGTIQKSAAALIVSSTGGNAGGLIGSASGGTVTGCYSGGHTIPETTTNAVVYDPADYNVTATKAEGATSGGVAGGLIGEAGTAVINYSYSTCSASGATVGGLIGTGSGNITSSYCTGRVKSTAETPVVGAFAAACGTTTDCHYFEIINEYADDTVGYDYMSAIAETETGDGSKDGVTALDADASEYNAFTSVWSDAVPYLEDSLKKYYGVGEGDARVAKYNLKSVEQLAGGTGSLKTDDDDTTVYFVATHYGDWPAPEIFVVNTQ